MLELSNISNFFELTETFPDDASCFEYLENLIWKGVPTCSFCGNQKKIYTLKNHKYKCSNCKGQFRVTFNTVFFSSRISLKKWFWAVYLFSSHKKGISSCQLAKDISVTQRTAWFILHRIREMMADIKPKKLKGIVMADESYFGGKESNKHKHKKVAQSGGRSLITKSAIVGMMQRDGDIIMKKVDSVDTKTITKLITKHVAKGSKVYTDEWRSYRQIPFEHEYIKHSKREYVRGDIHIQSLEGFWSHMKRGINGTYHHASKKHIESYAHEFGFRYNTRKMNEPERFNYCLNRIGRYLSYERLVNISHLTQ